MSRSNSNIEKHLEFVLSKFDPGGSTSGFFKSLLGKAFNWTYGKDFSLVKAKKIKNYLNKRFPGLFKFTYLDASGNLIEPLTDSEGRLIPRTLLKNFYADFRDLNLEKNTEVNKKWKLYQSFFGPLVDPKIAALNDHFHAADYRREKAFVYISSISQYGMFIIHIAKPDNWDFIGASYLVQNHNYLNKKLKVFLLDSKNTIISGRTWISENISKFQKVMKELEENYSGTTIFGKQIWAQRMISPDLKVCGFSDFPDNKKIQLSRERLTLVIIAVFIFLSWFSYLVITGKIALYLSIHLKLILLFLFSAGLPLAILTFTAAKFIEDKRKVLESQLHADVEKALLLFDKNYLQFQGRLQMKLTDGFQFLQNYEADVLEKAKQLMEEICKQYEPTYSRILNEKGEEVWNDSKLGKSQDVSMRPFREATKSIFNIMKKANEDIDMETDNQISALSMAIGGVGIETIFSYLTRNLGKLSQTNLGGGTQLTGFFPITDSKGKTKYLGLFAWNRNFLERRFVDTSKLFISQKWGNSIIYASNLNNHNFDRIEKFKNFSTIKDFLFKFLKKVEGKNQTQTDRFQMLDETILLTGVKGMELSEYHLIGLTSDDQIKLELKMLNWKFNIFTISMLLISLTVGGFLAKKFLVPVGNLSNGVQALKKREFSYQLPILDHDELGDLSATFNEMMVGLADLEVAKVVQENLFPSSGFTMGNFDVSGSCTSASQVGGDYFDYFPISDSKFAVLLGDVSGHGVGAAMVMAMAKAVISTPTHVGMDPAEVFGILNKLFIDTLKRKKMMTFFYGIIDCNSETITFSNAGQSYPYLIRDGDASHIEMPSSPLGTRKKNSFVSRQMKIQSNDIILLYSDGLIEAMTHDGKMLGYNSLKNALPTLVGENAHQTEKNIRKWHESVVKPGPLADDITVLILQLCKSQPSLS
ncbi:MAG: SpoIIE family protein phosphatase [Candidatus Riflebacteria bacterium]|nr:SpoIIE family protein phosphatase [Candidatus Riflebacteria bacterium]